MPAHTTRRRTVGRTFYSPSRTTGGRHTGAYAEIDGSGTPNDILRTPNFDRLAAEGVLFRDAFVTAPSSTPSRGGLLSGQHFWRTGRSAILQGAVWDPALPSYPLLLQSAGYHIGETYKVWSPGHPVDAPYHAPENSAEIRGASVVLIVTPELPVESFLLLANRIMPMLPAPRRHFLETAPEPLSHRPHMNREISSPASLAHMRESKKVEGCRLPPTRLF